MIRYILACLDCPHHKSQSVAVFDTEKEAHDEGVSLCRNPPPNCALDFVVVATNM